MRHKKRTPRKIHPLWFTAGLFAIIIAVAVVCSAMFAGAFTPSVPVTLTSNRTGLVMEPGAKVKLRGVEVGRVAGISSDKQRVNLKLDINPAQIRYIPANIGVEIKASTAFGAKYVDLAYPPHPSSARLTAGAVLHSRNVATEVNTVFENLVGLLNRIGVSKLNAVLTALAEGVRGQGERMGQAITAADQVLGEINPRMNTIAANWRSFKGFSDAYGAAASDIIAMLDAASTTATTITGHARDLDALLLNTLGFSNDAISLLGPSRDRLINGINQLQPTTALLLKYNPEYTCLLQGAQFWLDHGGYENAGGRNGYSLLADTAILFGDDPYRYPENLPIVAAKGGPGGKPGCGSLPDVSKNFPVRDVVTNTGWGTGLDLRPNPGIGHPCWVDYFPVTRAVPEPTSIRQCLPGPAPGPIPPAGAPPYGAPAADSTPLNPGIPPPTATPPGPPNAPEPPSPESVGPPR